MRRIESFKWGAGRDRRERKLVVGDLAAIFHSACDVCDRERTIVVAAMGAEYFGPFHPEWSLGRKQLGKQIRVTGQHMVHNENYVTSRRHAAAKITPILVDAVRSGNFIP